MELGQGGNSSVDIDHIVTLCVFQPLVCTLKLLRSRSLVWGV